MQIDTQEVVDKLEQAGVPPAQAKVHAAVLAGAVRAHDESVFSRCCTKQDLADAIAPLASKQDLALAKAELKSEFKAELQERLAIHAEQLEARIAASMRADFLKWGLTIVFGQTGLMALVIQLFDSF